MHELSVCQALIQQVEQLVADYRAECAEAIDVDIGELSGIDAGLFAGAFLVMKCGTSAASAELNLRRVRTCVLCKTCGTRSYTRPNRLVCGSCNGFQIRVVEGTELRLRDVKLRIREDSPRFDSVFK
jgi:hydrogenase nickel incorporation protein HypA/HybF